MQFPSPPDSCEPPPLPLGREELPPRDTRQLLAGLLYLGLSVPLLWIAWFFFAPGDGLLILFWLMLAPGGLLIMRGLDRCRRGPVLPPVFLTASWKAKQLSWWVARKAGGIAVVVAAGELNGKALAFRETTGINHLQLSLGCLFMVMGFVMIFIKGRSLKEILHPEPRLLPSLNAGTKKPLSRRGVVMVVCGVLLAAAALQVFLTFNGRDKHASLDFTMIFLFPGMLCLIFGLLVLRRWFLRILPATDDWEPEEY